MAANLLEEMRSRSAEMPPLRSPASGPPSTPLRDMPGSHLQGSPGSLLSSSPRVGSPDSSLQTPPMPRFMSRGQPLEQTPPRGLPSVPYVGAPGGVLSRSIPRDVPMPLPLSAQAGLADIANIDFSSMPVPDNTWMAVEQLELALEGVRFGVEHQLQAIESDTQRLESMYQNMRQQVLDAEFNSPGCTDTMRSLLVCYFPREANKEMIRKAFSAYGTIDSVYLVHKEGKPACYGFVNFHEHDAAADALCAANEERIELIDKRNVIWHVKAEWTLTAEIPKKPKKKRTAKKKDEGKPTSEESPTPPVALNKAMKGYHPKMAGMPAPLSGLPAHARFPRTLSYTVPTAPQF